MRKSKRMVVKFGSNVIVGKDNTIEIDRLRSLLHELSRFKDEGKELVLVTSGAVCSGAKELGFDEKPADATVRKASAAVGQALLVNMYSKCLSEFGQQIGQVLVNQEDLDSKEKRVALSETLSTLLGFGVIPVVNENDAVKSRATVFSDNDALAAMIACDIKADVLLLLTNVDGLFDNYPRTENSKIIESLTASDCAFAMQSANGQSSSGTGGMLSKIRAAFIAAGKGVSTIIANGHTASIISLLSNGGCLCTYIRRVI